MHKSDIALNLGQGLVIALSVAVILNPEMRHGAAAMVLWPLFLIVVLTILAKRGVLHKTPRDIYVENKDYRQWRARSPLFIAMALSGFTAALLTALQ